MRNGNGGVRASNDIPGTGNYDGRINAFADRSYRAYISVTLLIISQHRYYSRHRARLDVMSIFGHGPWANFLWGDVTYLTGKSVTGYRSVAVSTLLSLIVLASGMVQWPKLPGYTYLRRRKRTASKRIRFNRKPCEKCNEIHATRDYTCGLGAHLSNLIINDCACNCGHSRISFFSSSSRRPSHAVFYVVTYLFTIV